MFGSHLSIAGGMVNALKQARRFRMDCVQVFTSNQRQWKPSRLDAEDRVLWLAELRDMKWDCSQNDQQAPQRVVSHNSYLINLAQPDAELWRKSVNAHRMELERCESLHIPLCVAHPGAHLSPAGARLPGSRNDLECRPSGHELRGLKRIVKALDAIHRQLAGYRVMTCLETTVGSGTNLGYSFHQLAFIRENVRQPERVGFCLDTCHVTAAGYDMSSQEGARQVLAQWDEICGTKNLRVFHLNDSVGGLGSRRDRHAHIGEGTCSRCCFKAIVNHPAFARVPKILETPKGLDAKGVEWDLVNLRRLKRMARSTVTAGAFSR
jgi:deoxyribonuclease IV